MNNEGKTALITGASGGIGLAMARQLAHEGVGLILVARSGDILQQLKKELEEKDNVPVQILTMDLALPNAAGQLVEQIGEQPVDYLINNAGIGVFGPFADTPLERSRSMLDLNITAVTELTRLILPRMQKANSGNIMNIASIAAFQPGPGMAVYFASKAYVLSFSEALAYELRNSGISVTAYCPGATQTNFFSRADVDAGMPMLQQPMASAEAVARHALRCMRRGKRMAIFGLKNRLLILAERFATRGMTTAITAAMVGERT